MERKTKSRHLTQRGGGAKKAGWRGRRGGSVNIWGCVGRKVNGSPIDS